jgi:hypothetical protein
MATVNIYLKKNNQYERWARFDKTTTSITGSIWHIFPPDRLKGIKKGIHFTYPVDGDYHVSASLENGTDIKIFSDRGGIGVNGIWEKISKQEALKILPVVMIPDFKPRPLADYAATDNLFFPIVTMGIGRFDMSNTKIPKAKDFVIDCTDVDVSRTPNLVLKIIGINQASHLPPNAEIIAEQEFFDTYPKAYVGMFYGQ